jgi:hypothetical protein
MGGVEALIGVRVQNAGFRNPPVQQWGETIPSYLRALISRFSCMLFLSVRGF